MSISKKILFFFIVAVVVLFCPKSVFAAYYWVGGTTNSNTSNPDNWKTSAGVCADSGNLNVPGSSDIVQFVSNCVNDATVDSALSTGNFVINSGYSGTLTVNAATTINGQLTVNGNLSITNGGTVTVASGNQILIGYLLATDTGTITVDGTGSQLNNSNARIRVGNNGTGNLIIQNGGYANTGNVYAAYGTGSTGNITVDGNGTVWDVDQQGGLGFIGRMGTGSLVISNGGVVNSLATPWQIGGIAGSTGTVEITGPGSELNMTGDSCNLRIGYSSTGTLTISDNAAVNVLGTTGKITLADQAGSSGTLNIGNGFTMDLISTTLGIFTGSGTTALPPDPPSSLNGTVSSYDSISWDWDDVTGATGYKVYNSSDDSLLTTTSTANWTQTSLSPLSSYTVYIRSSNAQGVGYASSNATATTLSLPDNEEDTTPDLPETGQRILPFVLLGSAFLVMSLLYLNTNIFKSLIMHNQ